MIEVNEVDKVKVTTTIVVLIRQAVALANDMRGGSSPHVGYIREKLNSIPSPSSEYSPLVDKIVEMIFQHYGLGYGNIDYTQSLVGV